ncbi:MAG TPA: hypothetical protein VE954_08935 [Oligoflexus sp.]|uniref:hypothetical protein n=1 Tax=Oligoflexus sp. TaxID=1971216 RepID=UPI002D271E5F|nr:hypothetical protein [Oligoflexus sp.]HYX33227.1 hypothetical protein [Oligoflexus sp.]
MVRIITLLLSLVTSTLAFSRSETESLNLELQRLEKLKEETIQTDLEVNRIIREYERLAAKYKSDVENFGLERSNIDRIISSRAQDFKQLSEFIAETMDEVVNQSMTLERLKEIRSSYEVLKRTNQACSNEATHASFRRLVALGAGVANVKKQLVELTSSRRLPENFTAIYEKISSLIPPVSEVLEGVESAVTYYSGVLKYPEPCSAFNSLDTVLVLAQVAAETSQAAADLEKLSLSSFLKDIEIQRNIQRAETQLRRTLTGYEGKVINSLREGHLAFSMRTSASFENDLRLMSSPFVKNAETPVNSRKSIENQVAEASERIAEEYALAKLNTMEGQRQLLIIRAKKIHTKAFKLNTMDVPANLKDKKEQFLAYCQSELKLLVTGRFALQSTKTVNSNLELDSKIAKAEELLMPLEKGLSL